MNSNNADKWNSAVNKELSNMYTCRVMKILNIFTKAKYL